MVRRGDGQALTGAGEGKGREGKAEPSQTSHTSSRPFQPTSHATARLVTLNFAILDHAAALAVVPAAVRHFTNLIPLTVADSHLTLAAASTALRKTRAMFDLSNPLRRCKCPKEAINQFKDNIPEKSLSPRQQFRERRRRRHDPKRFLL